MTEPRTASYAHADTINAILARERGEVKGQVRAIPQAPFRLDQCEPWPGAPRYFKRLWDPAPINIKGRGVAFVTMPGPILIYGYACRSHYPEDVPVERLSWEQQGTFMAICFSEPYPDPDMGFVPMDEIEEVPEAELRAFASLWGVSGL